MTLGRFGFSVDKLIALDTFFFRDRVNLDSARRIRSVLCGRIGSVADDIAEGSGGS